MCVCVSKSAVCVCVRARGSVSVYVCVFFPNSNKRRPVMTAEIEDPIDQSDIAVVDVVKLHWAVTEAAWDCGRHGEWLEMHSDRLAIFSL